MINKAIFLYTFRRFLHWYTLLSGASVAILLAFFAAFLLAIGFHSSVDMARGLLFGPLVPLLVASSVVMPQVANSKSRKDGEYLSLLFTRPISRWSYVLTKFASGVVAALLFNILLVVLTVAIFSLFNGVFQLHRQIDFIDGYCLADCLFNAIGYSALVMPIACIPTPWSVIAIITFVYGALIFSTITGSAGVAFDMMSLSTMGKGLAATSECIASFFSVTLDSYHTVNSASFPLANFVTLFANIVFYLTAATVILNFREFFYAND